MHLGSHGAGGSSRAVAVAEHMEIGDGTALDERVGLFEFVVGLAGEPGDDIGAQGGLGKAAGERGRHLQVLGGRVGTAHPAKDRIGSALKRQVEVMCHPVARSVDGVLQGLIHLQRLDRTQPVAVGPSLFDEKSQKIGEGAFPGVAAPLSQVDAGEHDLPVASGGQEAHLLQDFGLGHAARRASSQRDDAVGAMGVASVLYLEEGPGVPVDMSEEIAVERGMVAVGRDYDRRARRAAAVRRGAGGFLSAEVVAAPVRPVASWQGPKQGRQVPGQPHLVDVSQHQVDPFNGGHRFGVHLGVATGGDHEAVGIEALGGAYLVPARPVALVRHSACVDHTDVGVLAPVDEFVPALTQSFLHLGGLALVEPAADGAEGDGAPQLWWDVARERHQKTRGC